METDPEFLLRRAREESVKAIETDQSPAADVHQTLAIHYSAKAAIALANGVDLQPDLEPNLETPPIDGARAE